MSRSIIFKLPSSQTFEVMDWNGNGDRHGYGTGLRLIKNEPGKAPDITYLDNYQIAMLRGFLGLSQITQE